ncbi:hypothetical protein DV737_g173, partial [Chaetothyriales sp. CBS 132003]
MTSANSTPEERGDLNDANASLELHDHRRKFLHVPHSASANPPRQVSPCLVGMENTELHRYDEVLGTPADIMARDFEQAIGEKSEDEFDNPPVSNRRGSIKPRQYTNTRPARPLNIGLRHDQSRDSSSSRASSPANSLEAFGEGRRQQRQRALTINSRASSPDFTRPRTHSHGTTQRRPTLSNVSVPANVAQRTDRDHHEEDLLGEDEEPGKTYKIDFEELDEFVALSDQGKIPWEFARSDSDSNEETPQVFEEIKHESGVEEAQNAAVNGETFYEKTLSPQMTVESHATTMTTTGTIKTAAQRLYEEWKDVERFTFFSSEIQAGIRARCLGELVSKETSFRDLFDVAAEGGVWWLDVVNPTKAELDVIAKAFRVHRLTKEDIETQEPREKVELFAQYYFVCFRSFNMNKKSADFLDPLHVYIVVFSDGVLSVSYTPNPHAKNVRKRIAKLGDFVSLGPDYICYAMIDDIVDSFQPIIHEAETASENIEDQVFVAREEDLSALLKQIGLCRKTVLNMMRLLGGKADVIKGFAKRCNEQYEMTPRGDIGLYLGDIQDHVVTMMSNLGHVEKMLSRSHANYLAQLNVNSIARGNGTNKNLAKITLIATILVPLNLVTGLFGMNVAVPFRESNSLAPFFSIIGVILVFVVLMLAVAKKVKAI